jgi:hypothetical protein
LHILAIVLDVGRCANMDFDGYKVENSFSFALQFAIKVYKASGHQYRIDYPRVNNPLLFQCYVSDDCAFLLLQKEKQHVVLLLLIAHCKLNFNKIK